MKPRHALLLVLGSAIMGMACQRPNRHPLVDVPIGEAGDSVALRLRVDSAHREIVATAGPFHLPGSAQSHHSTSSHSTGPQEGATLLRFEWPVSGWIRGFSLRIVDERGDTLPRSLVHHLVVVNFDRRQLLYPTIERIVALSRETGSVEVPAVIGVPLRNGQHLGMSLVWRNETGRDIRAVYLQLRMLWTPANHRPRPIDVLPIYMDVSDVIGSAYDLPPGRSSRSYEFAPPIDGKLLGVSGHLHDFGLAVRLEDAESGRVLVTVRTTRDTAGRLTGIEQKKGLGFLWNGLKLRAGPGYRLVGLYDNPKGDTLRLGAMAHMEGVFAPSSMAALPQIDPTNPYYQKDIALLLGSARNDPQVWQWVTPVGRR